MFTAARIKLTGWYLLIIILVSVIFSFIVYQGASFELDRGLRMQALRSAPRDHQEEIAQQASPSAAVRRGVDIKVLEEARERLAIQLVFINLGIWFISGFAAYFLAGKTLRPIEDSLEEQKRFISDASHELRTPLTALKTEIEVALLDKKLTIKQAKDLLASNLEEVDKMQDLSHYLLTLGKYQKTNINMTLEKVDLGDAIRKACAKVQRNAFSRNIKIIQEGSSKIAINVNNLSIVELITILLDNAIKYSHPGGSVQILTKIEKNHVHLIVKDFGIGIKASDIPYLFNRFYRADNSRSKTQVEGYGLGLSIAKSIVQLHKGKIAVESVPGEGSTFTVSLPLSKKVA